MAIKTHARCHAYAGRWFCARRVAMAELLLAQRAAKRNARRACLLTPRVPSGTAPHNQGLPSRAAIPGQPRRAGIRVRASMGESVRRKKMPRPTLGSADPLSWECVLAGPPAKRTIHNRLSSSSVPKYSATLRRNVGLREAARPRRRTPSI